MRQKPVLESLKASFCGKYFFFRMKRKVEEVRTALDNAVNLYEDVRSIVSSHASSFFVLDYMNTLFTEDLRDALFQLTVEAACELPSLRLSSDFRPAITDFLIRLRNVLNSDVIVPSKEEFFAECGVTTSRIDYACVACPDKKKHEVIASCDLVEGLTRKCGLRRVTDLGSGKGHLGSALATYCGLDVVCIECRAFLSESSARLHERHVKRLEKKTKIEAKGSGTFRIEADLINSSSDLERLNPDGEEFAIIGLHACGNLAVDAAQLYTRTKSCSAMFIVGCCYNMLVEEFDASDPYTVEERIAGRFRFPVSSFLREKSFGLSRNAKMLGLYAPDRINASSLERISNGPLDSSESPFFRAVLDFMMLESGVEKARGATVGSAFKKAKGDFVTYAEISWKNLNLDPSKFDEGRAKELYDQCSLLRKEFHIFQQFRTALSPLIEFIILVDRLLALLEEGFENSWLVRAFDPVISPRCYALVSHK
ncbi:unnamed protein product [Notodromas monacha]|uniref:Methyltransferase domain-containing protein n=1 Tax=Notodromas monacha TaxID=399045 RepID=A0A7R9BJV4_9CRUS|nr:unnamed protein product [Notodromas monacha]CAG0916852.1 unnamed protein product [Notodromas monacha]